MNAAQARKFSAFKPWDESEDILLDLILQLGLKTDDVEQGAQGIVLAQLNNSVRGGSITWIGQSNRLHGAKA